MKKNKQLLLLFIAIISFILFSSISLKGQNSDIVNLSIELRAIQSLTVNPLQKEVELIYDTEEKYELGIISEQIEHIEIFTTGGGFIVQASALYFEMTGDVTLIATPVSPNPTYDFTPVTLSQSPTTLITGIRGGRQKFNVSYDNSAGANKYTEMDHDIYLTTVTYLIIPG